ncbi:MAG: hypothetical protein HQK54_13700 [Oligoflexales bacterium]|nr:hypothetical protein [Oligoflexales bacterium]
MSKTKSNPKNKTDYTVEKKRSGRYSVVGKNGKYINGEEKVKILVKEGLIKLSKKSEKKEEAAQ